MFGLIAQQSAEATVAFPAKAGAALGVGIAALGAGIAEGGIGAAAVGAIAEDRDFFGIGLLFTVLPETLVILAIVVIFIV
ncbi:F0F1 ATP synthase subunit C [Halarchaeum sp. P4]|uniref:F0F1 ATP synthase subunit C n=1 Tax=Halarchaeum sp. P4 TaxID=3421639 RepID=UPI003EB96B44